MADDDFHDFSDLSRLRAALDVWPIDRLPENLDDVARIALTLTVGDILHDRAAQLNLVRFASDGVSLWRMDAIGGVTLEDFIRAIAGVFEPAAFGLAVVQPMRADGDPTTRGVHCRAAFGDEMIELTADVEGAHGPVEARSVATWQMRRGRAHTDAARWIGVPPTTEIHLPMLDVAEG